MMMPLVPDLKVSVEKLRDRCDGLMRLGKLHPEHLEDVDHTIPTLQMNIDTGGARQVGKHDGIIQHGFAGRRPGSEAVASPQGRA